MPGLNKYFGSIKTNKSAIPRVTVTEPDWKSERRYNETAPIVPFPATVITYLAPPSKSPDIPAIRLAETILSGGESSRLYQELVRNQKIAQEASFNADIRVDKGLLYFLGITSEGHTSAELEKAFLAELKKIQDTSGFRAGIGKSEKPIDYANFAEAAKTMTVKPSPSNAPLPIKAIRRRLIVTFNNCKPSLPPIFSA